jgi:apolipoprotein N-acyltransferase
VTLSRLAQTIVLAQGWSRIPDRIPRRCGVGAGAAADKHLAGSLRHLPILIWLVDGCGWASRRRTRRRHGGWWFGFGYFLAGLYWLGHAFLVDAKTFGWLLPFAVIALPAGMAIYTALGLALARADLDARRHRDPRARGGAHAGGVAARPPVQRLSLEHVSAMR